MDFKDRGAQKPHKTLASILWIQMYKENLRYPTHPFVQFQCDCSFFFFKFVLNVVILIYDVSYL